MNKNEAQTLKTLLLDKVEPSLANPRLTMERGAFDELKKSILKNGLLQPIAVRVASDNTYEIVGGHRRYHAVRELSREHPSDARFATIAALIVELDDAHVAAARLAENLNRSDLSPLEIAEGVGDALKNGMTEDELAESLGWAKRNVYRYKQFNDAPAWLKAFANEVPIPKKKLDDNGAPVLHAVTDAPVHDVEKLPGLKFTHLFELLTFYGVLRDADQLELEERGGEHFRPQAERTIKKLARAAAKDDWSIAKLRAEIKRIKDPTPRTSPSDKAKPPFVINADRITIDLTRKLARNERDELAQQLTNALAALGLKAVPISAKPA
jgi:ParB/RepB/Spo0J family partition protein